MAVLSACETDVRFPRKVWDLDDTASAQAAPTTMAPPEGAVSTVPPGMAQPLQKTKVALLLPLSGKQSQLGQAMLQAAQTALFDIGGDSLELLPRDTQGTPQAAQEAARTALAEGAQLLLGPVFADEVRAVKAVHTGNDVPMIAFSTDWTLANDNSYMLGFMPFDQIERIAAFAARKGIQRVGILAPDTAYGRVVSAAFGDFARRFGIQIVDSLLLNPNDSRADRLRRFARFDARANAGAMSALPYDGIFIPFAAAEAAAISRDLTGLGLPAPHVRRLGTGLWDGENVSGLDGAWYAAPDPKTRIRFEKRYAELYGHKPPRLASLAYDSTALAAVLAKMSAPRGDVTPYTRETLLNANGFAGIDGIFRFRNDALAERGLAVLEISGGRSRMIEAAPRSFQK
ncbi:MAG: penicillin-binding protein activator [Alphaproteobacteria bacterium]|nr:penicillin-binding protein activator [Alphaproteobacteria bacterium]